MEEFKPEQNKNINLITPIKDKMQIRILIELYINEELSLTQLSKRLKKSKSTIHRHLKNLIYWDFISISRLEKVRGSIKAKYYKINKNILSSEKMHFNKENSSFKENKQELVNDDFSGLVKINSIINILKKPIDILKSIIDLRLYEQDVENKDLNKTLETLKPSFCYVFLNEQQQLEIKKILYDTQIKIKELISKEKKPHKKVLRPYLLTTLMINMNELLKFESK